MIICGFDRRSEWLFGVFASRSPDLSYAFAPPLVAILLHPLWWQVEAHHSCINKFLDNGWHECVAPFLAFLDACAGADGFGGGDINGG